MLESARPRELGAVGAAKNKRKQVFLERKQVFRVQESA
jgi:hypothetical protein